MPGRLIIALAAALVLLTTPALAHDSGAPRGAEHRWLPIERWVQKHWLPYDESRLYELLGVSTRGVFEWLADDHRTLAQLARRRGVSTRTLAKRLLPRGARRSPRASTACCASARGARSRRGISRSTCSSTCSTGRI